MEKYLKLKFGISDINKFEYKQIENLPKSLKKYIPSNVKLTEEGLIMDRPKDFTGEYSKNIIEFGKVRNEYFWKCVEEICALFKENNLWYYDVFYKGNNILVKKVTTDKFVPIIVDIKAIGRKLNPLQINLILRSEQKRKFYRRFNKFKVKYYQKNNQPIKENYEKCI